MKRGLDLKKSTSVQFIRTPSDASPLLLHTHTYKIPPPPPSPPLGGFLLVGIWAWWAIFF